MGDLTKNFSVSEFLRFDNGKQLAAIGQILDWKNKRARLLLLCQTILQPIRDANGTMTIESGYRTPEWNAKVGGSRTSDHMWAEGCCADFDPTADKIAVCNWILSNLPYAFGEVIYYLDTGHIHVGLPTEKDHGQFLVIHKARKQTTEIQWRGDLTGAMGQLRSLIAAK